MALLESMGRNETLVWSSTCRIPCRPDYNWARLKVHDGKYVKDIVTSTTRILVPVYHNYHYSLLDVNMGTGVIRHHDSLGLSGHLSTRESAEWYQMAKNMVQVIREKNGWNNQPEMQVVDPYLCGHRAKTKTWGETLVSYTCSIT